jgi:hypothetical protein
MENHGDAAPEWVVGPQPPREGEVDVVARDGSSHRMRWASLTLLVALVAGTVVVYDDHRSEVHEAVAVAACEHSLRLASDLSERTMGLLVSYIQPAMRTVDGVQHLHLADLMAERATRVLPRAQRADRVCRAVTVRRWHFSLIARRDAARAYSGALVTLLQTIAAQGSRPFSDDAALVRLQSAAGAG